MAENSTAMRYIVGVGAVIAIATPTFIVGQYVSDLRHEMDASKREVENLRGQIQQLQTILEQTTSSEKGKPGADGREVELRATTSHIQWRYLGDDWSNLVPLSELRGPKGDPGENGAAEPQRSSSRENHTPSNVAGVVPSTQPPELMGQWRGNVACKTMSFSVELNVTKMQGRTGIGEWLWSGSTRGKDQASLSPVAGSNNNDFMLITAKSNTFDYRVALAGDEMTGKSTNGDCDISITR